MKKQIFVILWFSSTLVPSVIAGIGEQVQIRKTNQSEQAVQNSSLVTYKNQQEAAGNKASGKRYIVIEEQQFQKLYESNVKAGIKKFLESPQFKDQLEKSSKNDPERVKLEIEVYNRQMFPHRNPDATDLQMTLGLIFDIAAIGAEGALAYYTHATGFLNRIKWHFLRLPGEWAIDALRKNAYMEIGADSILERKVLVGPFGSASIFSSLIQTIKYGTFFARDIKSKDARWFGSKSYDSLNCLLALSSAGLIAKMV